jgi:hypothetical protein
MALHDGVFDFEEQLVYSIDPVENETGGVRESIDGR